MASGTTPTVLPALSPTPLLIAASHNTGIACLQDNYGSLELSFLPSTPVQQGPSQVLWSLTPKVTQLSSGFALVRHHNLLVITATSDSLSALSLDVASMVKAVNGSSLPSALNLSSYSSVPHRGVPADDGDDGALVDEFNGVGHVVPMSPGHDWYLQVGIDYKDGQDDIMILLLGLATTIEIPASILTDFRLLLVDKSTKYPALTSGQEDEGFPTTAVIAFKYILLHNKRMLQGGSQPVSATPTPSSIISRYNDEEEYKAPTSMWGTLRVQASENVKDCVDALVCDLSDTGISIRWKEHQSAVSSSQVLLICIPMCLIEKVLKRRFTTA